MLFNLWGSENFQHFLSHSEYSASKAKQVLILTVNDATCIRQWTFQMVIYDSNCAHDDNVVVYYYYYYFSKQKRWQYLTRFAIPSLKVQSLSKLVTNNSTGQAQANANWNLILWVLFIFSVKSKILTPWEIMEVGTYPTSSSFFNPFY